MAGFSKGATPALPLFLEAVKATIWKGGEESHVDRILIPYSNIRYLHAVNSASPEETQNKLIDEALVSEAERRKTKQRARQKQ